MKRLLFLLPLVLLLTSSCRLDEPYQVMYVAWSDGPMSITYLNEDGKKVTTEEVDRWEHKFMADMNTDVMLQAGLLSGTHLRIAVARDGAFVEDLERNCGGCALVIEGTLTRGKFK